MFSRHIEPFLKAAARKYPVVTVTGPRQSGKTTVARRTFPAHEYVSLEAPDHRAFAAEDPRGFLRQFEVGVVLDEVQNAPDLFSYIQGIVDEGDRAGRFVLTGSQNFLLMEKVTQSLAGRSTIFNLLPFSRAELAGRAPASLKNVGRKAPKKTAMKEDLFPTLFTGFYPRIHDQKLDPQDWLRNYYQTYVERDVRSLVNVGALDIFGRFVQLCAGRCGQLLNLSSLGSDCGVSHVTARRWMSVLEASFIVYRLRPFHKSFNKRIIKSPKLYFLDTGLLCYLLRIRSPEDLVTHAMRGAVFESFVLSELLKTCYHQGLGANVYFWRDSAGHEIDLLIDRGKELVPIEVKSGETVAEDFFKGIEFWRSLPGQAKAPACLVYGGETSYQRRGAIVYSWRNWM